MPREKRKAAVFAYGGGENRMHKMKFIVTAVFSLICIACVVLGFLLAVRGLLQLAC